MGGIIMEEEIELSCTDIKYTPCRGNMPSYTIKYPINLGQSVASAVFFSVHSITHFDLPWTIEDRIKDIREKDSDVRPLPMPEEINEVMIEYNKIKLFDTVVIDITNKLTEMKKKYIDEETKYIHSDLDEFKFRDLMDSLMITPEDLEEVPEELDDRFILFKTGWKDLNPRVVNLTNPYFELRHPYLIPPYLEYDTMKWLVKDKGIKGIGSDSYGLENSIYQTNPHYLPKYAKEYYYNYKKPTFPPVLVTLMSERRYYLKNLRHFEHIITKKGYALGKIHIIPFSLGNRDANLARVFFRTEKV
jgi:kynurenine formamidase